MLEDMNKDLEEFVNGKWAKELFSMKRYQDSVHAEELEEISLAKSLEIAKNMLKENLPIDIISKTTGLSEEEVMNLKKED